MRWFSRKKGALPWGARLFPYFVFRCTCESVAFEWECGRLFDGVRITLPDLSRDLVVGPPVETCLVRDRVV
jgi:hypothetical protein